MKLLVTGASGFLGRHVVVESLRRGHEVRAMVRPRSDVPAVPWARDVRVELIRADLRAPGDLSDVLGGVDAVLHLAAVKAGSFYDQFDGTVRGTENLLQAMTLAGTRRLIAISSFSVYEYRRRWTLSLLDESSALERNPEARDAYCRTKLIQEKLVRDWARTHEGVCTVLRPGVIFGPGNLWTARLGVRLGERWWIRIGGWAAVPLTYVENCAEAVVMAAENPSAAGQVLNVVDDACPTQRRLARLLQDRIHPAPHILPVPWSALRIAAALVTAVNRLFCGGRAAVPGILVSSRLHARCKPLRYSNAAVRRSLGWKPRYSLEEALDRSSTGRRCDTEQRDARSAGAAGVVPPGSSTALAARYR